MNKRSLWEKLDLKRVKEFQNQRFVSRETKVPCWWENETLKSGVCLVISLRLKFDSCQLVWQLSHRLPCLNVIMVYRSVSRFLVLCSKTEIKRSPQSSTLVMLTIDFPSRLIGKTHFSQSERISWGKFLFTPPSFSRSHSILQSQLNGFPPRDLETIEKLDSLRSHFYR